MKHVILACTMAAGMAWAQSPQVIQNTRSAMNTVQQNATAASNQALGISQSPKDAHAAAKPAAGPAKSAPMVVKNSAPTAKPALVPAKAPATAKASIAPAKDPTVAKKPAASGHQKLGVKQVAAKPAGPKKETKAEAPKQVEAAAKTVPPAATSPADADSAASSEEAKSDDDADKQDKKWSMSGKRDPFISPVVNHAGGSGCSTGKKCLEIGAINLRGIVHSDAGFIAVVTNSLNKAYFLRENDPVFDGYVVKITGDSIIFKETLQDRLGKTFTREVTKKITTPAV